MVQTNYAQGSELPANQLNTDFSHCVNVAGDTMLGLLTLSGTPTNPLHAATKSYVDSLFVPVGAGFGTGIGQVPQFINFQGSGHPGLTLVDRIVLQRGTAGALDFADIQLNRVTSFSGGSATQLNAALRITTTVGANDATQEYGIISQTINNSTTGGPGYAGFFTAQRPVGTVGGTLIVGANAGAADSTVGPSSVSGGGVVGMEIHAGGQQADDAANPQAFGGHGVRKVIHLSAQHTVADGLQAEISHGIWAGLVAPDGVTADTLSNFDSLIGFAINTQVRIGLDMRGAIAPNASTDPVSAVTMSAGHVIDFNGSASLTSNPGGCTLRWDSANSKWKVAIAGVDMLSIDTSGNIRAKGTITPSVTP